MNKNHSLFLFHLLCVKKAFVLLAVILISLEPYLTYSVLTSETWFVYDNNPIHRMIERGVQPHKQGECARCAAP